MRMPSLFHLVTAFLFVGGSAAFAQGADSPKPNVLVIVADDLGYGDVGVHGCKDVATPNIDSLARNGVRFTSGYVSGPYCSPTRAGLMTGRYQERFGHEFNPGPPGESTREIGLSLDETTFPERMKAAGYRTGMVGKWHLGDVEKFNPIRRGFEEFYGFLGGAHPYFGDGPKNNPILRGTQPVEQPGYLTEALAREAIAYLDRHAGKPFFLYLAFNAVHTPMQATDKYLERFEKIADPKRRTYAAMLSSMDDAIGKVLAKLREAGIEENTLVFFISDNGGPPQANGSNNAPLRGQKAQTWEGGVRVPFLIQWKGRLPGGKLYHQPVIQLDILPTALAAAGVETKPEWKLDGVNLLPYLNGQRTGAPHAALYWRFGQQTAIRMGDWKLVKAPGVGPEGKPARRGGAGMNGAGLFNLANDLGEQDDLAAKHPEKVQELAAAWNQWNAQLVDPKWVPGDRAAKKPAGGARKKARRD